MLETPSTMAERAPSIWILFRSVSEDLKTLLPKAIVKGKAK